MKKYIKKDEINEEIIQEIAENIKQGKLVVFPTDTVYAIGTNAYDGEACEKIYEVKGRPEYKPLIILISNIEMLINSVPSITPVEKRLIDAFWPGALTIKFKKKDGVFPSIISAGDEYIRVRLLNEGIAYELVKAASVPIVAPSANLSGSKTGTKTEDIISELGEKVDYFIDYGDIESDTVSTIVEVEDEEIILIREGKITKKELERIAPIRKVL